MACSITYLSACLCFLTQLTPVSGPSASDDDAP